MTDAATQDTGTASAADTAALTPEQIQAAAEATAAAARAKEDAPDEAGLNERPQDPTIKPAPEVVLADDTLETYLDESLPSGYGEFRLVANRNPDKTIKFYIHPLNKDGKTRDFAVDGDKIRCTTRIVVA
jgi:hypothetical protein